MLRGNLPCFSLCLLPVVLSLGTTEKNPGSAFLALSLFPTLRRSSWAFSSSGRTVPALWAISVMRHVPVPSWSLWPFIGLSPVCPCLSLVSASCQGPGTCVWSVCWTVYSLAQSPFMKVHHPYFSLLPCFLHPGICKGCTSCVCILQATWRNFF